MMIVVGILNLFSNPGLKFCYDPSVHVMSSLVRD